MLEKLKLFIQYDNAFMWLLAILSITGLFFIVDRLLKFRSWYIKVDTFIQGVLNNLRNKQIISATTICERTPGPIAHLIGKIISNREKSREEMENSIVANYLTQVALLNKNLRILLIIAHLAPLVGLLGTIWSLIEIFDVVKVSSFTNINNIAQYVVTALTTTALGLSISIIFYGFYNYFVITVERIIQDMEITIAQVIEFLEEEKAQNNDAT